MTTQEANDNIGQEFKTTFLKGGKFDIIRKVDPDGVIHGDFLIAYAKDCRLKGPEPESLKHSHKQKIK